MDVKRFTKNDEGFTCAHCGASVPPLGYTSRDHCPFCLHSLHVDVNPGDRASDCGGDLVPVRVLPDPKKEFVIEYRCSKCGASRRCKAAVRGNIPDDRRLLISLTSGAGLS